MTKIRICLSALAAACAAFSAAQSPYLSYEFNGTLAPTTGTGPSLVGNGGTVDADSYDFAAGQGLSLATSALESTTEYTIHLGFSIDNTPGYNKIIDTKDRSQDQGVYILNGTLIYYPGTGSSTSIGDNQFIQLTLVRNGTTNEVRSYVNGTPAFSVVDTSFAATFSGTNVWFFQDDLQQNGEHSGGTADFIRLYSGALNDAQVQAINNPVPEPATMAALGLGAAALLRRRRKA